MITNKYNYPDTNDKITSTYIDNNGVEYSKYWNQSEKRVFREIIDYFKKSNEKLSVLDIGCGTGRLFEYYLSYSSSVVAIEPDYERYLSAKTTLQKIDFENKVQLYNTEISEIDLSLKFDVILCSHVIQHISNEKLLELLSFIQLYSKKETIIFITTTFTSSNKTCYEKQTLTVNNKYDLHYVSEDEFNEKFATEGTLYCRMFNILDLEKILNDNNIKIINKIPFHILPEIWSQNKYIDGEKYESFENCRDVLIIASITSSLFFSGKICYLFSFIYQTAKNKQLMHSKELKNSSNNKNNNNISFTGIENEYETVRKFLYGDDDLYKGERYVWDKGCETIININNEEKNYKSTIVFSKFFQDHNHNFEIENKILNYANICINLELNENTTIDELIFLKQIGERELPDNQISLYIDSKKYIGKTFIDILNQKCHDVLNETNNLWDINSHTNSTDIKKKYQSKYCSILELNEIKSIEYKSLIIDEIYKSDKYRRVLYGLLTGDEGYEFVPQFIIDDRINNYWTTRSFVTYIGYKNSYLLLNLTNIKITSYLNRESIFHVTYFNELSDYFSIIPKIAGLDHGILHSIEKTYNIKLGIEYLLNDYKIKDDKKDTNKNNLFVNMLFTLIFRANSRKLYEKKRLLLNQSINLLQINMGEMMEMEKITISGAELSTTIKHATVKLENDDANLMKGYTMQHNFALKLLSFSTLLIALFNYILALGAEKTINLYLSEIFGDDVSYGNILLILSIVGIIVIVVIIASLYNKNTN